MAAGTALGPTRSLSEPLPSPLALADALEFARRHQPDLQTSVSEIEIARSDSVAAAIRPFNPELEIGFSRGGESLASGEEASIALGINQEFDTWHKRRLRQALAAARLRTSEAGLTLRRQQIESQVRARFETALFLQGRLRLLAALSEQEQRIVASTRSRVREESVTPLTGRLTELDWVRIERELLVTQTDFHQAAMALAAATGGVPPAGFELAGTSEPDSLGMSEDSMVAMAAANRSDSKRLEQRIADLQVELRQARIEGRPNLRLGAGVSRERSGFSGQDLSGDPAVTGAIHGLDEVDQRWEVKLSVPLALWERNQGPQARTLAEAGRARAELARTQFEIELEVRAAARAFDDALRLVRLYQRRGDRVRDDLALVRAAYADGRISLDSYLTQKGRLVDTLLDQLAAEDRYWETRGRLQIATGADFATLARGGLK